jgi:cysteine-S-conjugate beta-lyase
VALSPGTDFGRPGHGFARLNVATSPAILDLILERISDALAER